MRAGRPGASVRSTSPGCVSSATATRTVSTGVIALRRCSALGKSNGSVGVVSAGVTATGTHLQSQPSHPAESSGVASEVVASEPAAFSPSSPAGALLGFALFVVGEPGGPPAAPAPPTLPAAPARPGPPSPPMPPLCPASPLDAVPAPLVLCAPGPAAEKPPLAWGGVSAVSSLGAAPSPPPPFPPIDKSPAWMSPPARTEIDSTSPSGTTEPGGASRVVGAMGGGTPRLSSLGVRPSSSDAAGAQLGSTSRSVGQDSRRSR